MNITDAPVALPGTCIFCPGSVRERFIDTGIQIEWYGAVIICDQCIVAMGQMFGMLTKEQAQGLENRIATKENEIFELKKALAGLENIRLGLALAGYVVPDDPGYEPVPSSTHQGDAGRLPPSTSDVGAQGGTPPKSLHDEGLAELRSDASSSGGILSL